MVGWLSILIVGNIGGALVSAVFALILGGIAIAIKIIVTIIFMIVSIVDIVYRMSKGIKLDCQECKKQFSLAAYECPNCGRRHYKLIPNKYGIFSHKCTCGQKIPSTFFNGRTKLIAHCPRCDAALESDSTKSVIIQLIGGSSSGKTVFLSAFYNLNSLKIIYYT